MIKYTTKNIFLRLSIYKMITLFVFLFIATNGIYAQTTEPKKISKSDDISVKVDKQPEFPGGDEARTIYLNNNIIYPVEAQKKGIQGRVIIGFVVEKNGSITSPHIIRSVDSLLDQATIDVINSMPKWIPGEFNNEIVRAKFILPISFKLYGEQNDKIKKISESDEIYAEVDKQPEFPGGDEARKKYLNENIRFPEQEGCGMPGRTIVSFIVEKDGSLTNLQVIRGLDPSLDKEALRVIENMPKWIPGERNGEIVRVKFVLPIGFISSHYR